MYKPLQKINILEWFIVFKDDCPLYYFETQELSAYSPGFLPSLIKTTLVSAIVGLIIGFLSVNLLNNWF